MRLILRCGNLLLIGVILCLLMGFQASADDGFSCHITVRSDTGIVAVSGTLPMLYANAVVVFQAINPGKQLNDLKPTLSLLMTQVINYQEETTADGNGVFAFQYKMDGITGVYTVNIGVSGNSIPYTKTFTYYGKEYIDQIIIDINQAKVQQDANKIQKLITDNYEIMSLNSTVYENFVSQGSNLDAFYNMMVKNGQISTVDELQNQLSGTVLLMNINLATPKTWGSLKDVLETNKELFQLDFTKFNKLKSPDEVYRSMEGMSFTSLPNVKEEFDNAVDARYLAENTAKSTGSRSSSSGGGGGGSYSVSQPAASIIPTPAVTKEFVDLAGCAWAKDSIDALYSKGIVSGKDDKHFMPNDKITREEFVKLLVMATNMLSQSAESDFTDVKKDKWYYPYIASALNKKLVTGKDEKAFGVGENITREDMAAITYRAIMLIKPELKSNKPDGTFADMQNISGYAADGVAFMQNVKLIQGTSDSLFSPKEYSTRAQTAVIINRLIEFLK